MSKKVREKSRECHNHKPQPFPDPKRKRKPINQNKHKPNKRRKSTKTFVSLEYHKTKQEAKGPQLARLSDIATADMQMLCNIFPILSLQLMTGSSFKQFLILKKNIQYSSNISRYSGSITLKLRCGQSTICPNTRPLWPKLNFIYLGVLCKYILVSVLLVLYWYTYCILYFVILIK